MIRSLTLLALLVSGCNLAPEPAGGLAALDVGSVVVFQRNVFDVAYSAITGRDCSGVRMAHGLSYCRPTDPPPAPPAYCTRSLAQVDCWNSAANLGRPPPRGVAEGPATLTPEQEAWRTRRWPNF